MKIKNLLSRIFTHENFSDVMFGVLAGVAAFVLFLPRHPIGLAVVVGIMAFVLIVLQLRWSTSRPRLAAAVMVLILIPVVLRHTGFISWLFQ